MSFLDSGSYDIGCNYWASNAGLYMWRDWDETVVARDFDALAGNDIRILRIFPLWNYFQPLEMLKGCFDRPMEHQFIPQTADDEPVGDAMLSKAMLARMRRLLDLAQSHRFQVVFSLVCGWMSSRLCVPPCMNNRNLMTDHGALELQTAYVRGMVRAFKEHPAIVAWELGNESNCMQRMTSPDDTWLWTYVVSSAIRLEDASRPVCSGMHSLQVESEKPWNIAQQGALCDVLTTHPYPLFTPHCNRSPYDTIPADLHAIAESCLYADLSGKPCFIEETNALGTMVASDERIARSFRSTVFGAWAHDLHASVWWCSFMQDGLTEPPYDWSAIERNLGLFKADAARTPKPSARMLSDIIRRLRQFPVRTLAPRVRDAVCILPRQYADMWKIAYGTFSLALQAGLSIRFCACGMPLPEAPIYIIPCLQDDMSISRSLWDAVLKRVENGASVLVTNRDGLIEPFESPFGCHVDFHNEWPCEEEVILDGEKNSLSMTHKTRLVTDGAVALATYADGSPFLTCSAYGKGFCCFCPYPLESACIDNPRLPLPRFYKAFLRGCAYPTAFPDKPDPIGITRHPEANRTIYLAVNYSNEPQRMANPFPAAEIYPPQAAAADGAIVFSPNETVMLVKPEP